MGLVMIPNDDLSLKASRVLAKLMSRIAELERKVEILQARNHSGKPIRDPRVSFQRPGLSPDLERPLD